MIPSIFGAIVLLIGIWLSPVNTLYLVTIATMFGGTAAAYLIGLAGATINPAVFSLIFVYLRAFKICTIEELARIVKFNSAVSWWVLLATWGLISAVTLPFLFGSSDILVYTFDRFAATAGTAPYPLPIRFSSANISQPGYLIISVLCTIAISVLLRQKGGAEKFADAVLWTATLNSIAGLLNLLQMVGLPDILIIFKNATYVMMRGEIAGLVRISGTFPETSAYSAFSLGLLGFTHYLWMMRYKPLWSGTTSISLLTLLMLSTSGTAYVGLAGCFAIALAFLVYKTIKTGSAGPQALYGWLALAAAFLGCAALLFKPELIDTISDYFGTVIGKKMESSSGIERMNWNRQAWSNFVDTLGLGTGLGTSVGSNFTMVLLSNLGWFGAITFSVATWKTLFAETYPRDSTDSIVTTASRLFIVTALVGANVSSRVFDLGILFYIMLAGATFTTSTHAQTDKSEK